MGMDRAIEILKSLIKDQENRRDRATDNDYYVMHANVRSGIVLALDALERERRKDV